MTDFNKHYMKTQGEKIRNQILQPPLDKSEMTRLAPPSGVTEGGVEDWYYVFDGQKLGPESSKTLIGWVSSGTLSLDDLVWRTGMIDWLPICNTELIPNSYDTPPPLSGEHVNNTVVWSWAFAPLIPISFILVNVGLAPTQALENQWIAAFAVNNNLLVDRRQAD